MVEDSQILVVPELLATQINFQCHNKLGFHFSTNQMKCFLSPLIYPPCLQDLIHEIVKKCLICTISAPKRVRNLIGAQRSNYYVPSQCLVIANTYLPRSQHGYSKVLILVDAATGYVIIYPSLNLHASTVRKHLLCYLSSHLLPEEITADQRVTRVSVSSRSRDQEYRDSRSRLGLVHNSEACLVSVSSRRQHLESVSSRSRLGDKILSQSSLGLVS